MLGPVSVGCVGVGAAIGSGIFATPHEAARHLHSPWAILVLWVIAGTITFLQTLVTAELATRMPRAGGEYQYLKEAYGPFAAFFFGWSFTVFIIGAGAGTIAALFGDVTCELLQLHGHWASAALGCAAIIAVAILNATGLRTGAITQNILTIAKALALVGIAIGAVVLSGRMIPVPSFSPRPHSAAGPVESFFLALLPVFWSYTGATDSAKLAEEAKDSSRSLPLALGGSALLLTIVYFLYNYALLCGASATEMAEQKNVPAFVFAKAGHPSAAGALLAIAALVCLGSISSTLLANVRVLFAMARDGLAPKLFATMSDRQSPIAAIILAAALGCAFVVNRRFEEILRIYFLASAVLFGLTYLSLIIFRRREHSGEWPNIFRLPLAVPIVLLLVAIEVAMAANIVIGDIRDGSPDCIYTVLMLTAMASFYFIWRQFEKKSRVEN
jgi:APA family basic amino acid/polyamine antiporter